MFENKLFIYIIYLLGIFIIWGTSAAVAIRLGDSGVMVAPMFTTFFVTLFVYFCHMKR